MSSSATSYYSTTEDEEEKQDAAAPALQALPPPPQTVLPSPPIQVLNELRKDMEELRKEEAKVLQAECEAEINALRQQNHDLAKSLQVRKKELQRQQHTEVEPTTQPSSAETSVSNTPRRKWSRRRSPEPAARNRLLRGTRTKSRLLRAKTEIWPDCRSTAPVE